MYIGIHIIIIIFLTLKLIIIIIYFTVLYDTKKKINFYPIFPIKAHSVYLEFMT